MLDNKLSILQVVGYQNSGKTTLIEKLCQLAECEGLKLGCFKHHGHGGTPDRLFKEKDTDRYIQAGAYAAGVEGEGEFHFSMQDFTLEQLLNMCQHLPLDAVLIEGTNRRLIAKSFVSRMKRSLLTFQLFLIYKQLFIFLKRIH